MLATALCRTLLDAPFLQTPDQEKILRVLKQLGDRGRMQLQEFEHGGVVEVELYLTLSSASAQVQCLPICPPFLHLVLPLYPPGPDGRVPARLGRVGGTAPGDRELDGVRVGGRVPVYPGHHLGECHLAAAGRVAGRALAEQVLEDGPQQRWGVPWVGVVEGVARLWGVGLEGGQLRRGAALLLTQGQAELACWRHLALVPCQLAC